TWLGGGVDTGSNRFVTTAITFLATALFGAILVWLRRKSGSLVAPALAHLATNSVTFAVAWIAS
ncbi:MAG TPA: CPBP family glutamic-type intramembrane protease, partial [Microthrixaceae bacterium]|nr:CPBP family glutamic-type intramembrane protease [Microthrixaceae bacterium]